MSIGFEEDSVFYTHPKQALSENTPQVLPKETNKDEDFENQTTFYYDPNHDE